MDHNRAKAQAPIHSVVTTGVPTVLSMQWRRSTRNTEDFCAKSPEISSLKHWGPPKKKTKEEEPRKITKKQSAKKRNLWGLT